MAKNSKKGKGGGKSAQQRQQQEAAARRRGAGPGLNRAAAPTSVESTPTATQHTNATPETGEPQVRWFLDVSAVRIQEWLARTPDLKVRRGASVLLSEATAQDEWEPRLPGGTEWNTEAGSVDGVVSLQLAADDDSERRLDDAARHVAARMRQKMPYIHIQAVARKGAQFDVESRPLVVREGDADLGPARSALARRCLVLFDCENIERCGRVRC